MGDRDYYYIVVDIAQFDLELAEKIWFNDYSGSNHGTMMFIV